MRLAKSYRRLPWTGGVLALLLAGVPAAGDWLVTREGGRVETQGKWMVKGKLVVFETKAGALSSLRLAEVDLEASAQATQEAAEAAQAKALELEKPEAPRRKSVVVITDADVAHVEPADETGEGEKKEPAAASEPAQRPRGPVAADPQSVVVGTWESRDLPDKTGLELAGEIENKSDEIATELQLVVTLLDNAKQILDSGEAVLAVPALRPGGKTGFRAVFPGTFSFAEATFDVRSKGLKLKVAPEEDKPREDAVEDSGAPPRW